MSLEMAKKAPSVAPTLADKTICTQPGDQAPATAILDLPSRIPLPILSPRFLQAWAFLCFVVATSFFFLGTVWRAAPLQALSCSLLPHRAAGRGGSLAFNTEARSCSRRSCSSPGHESVCRTMQRDVE